MKKILTIALCIIFLASCKEGKTIKPSSAMDTGTTFIRASLDGDFKSAEELLLKDTLNGQLFDSYKAMYERLPADKKKNYKDASYNINKYLELNDSVAIINYSNSFMKKPMEIKIVRSNKDWKIDFKYITSGNLPIN